MIAILSYMLLWASFGAGHSYLAAPGGRALLLQLAGRGDRLAYNLIAAAHLALVLAIGRLLFPDHAFNLPREIILPGWIAAGAGAIVVGLAGRNYDLARFTGLAQFRAGKPDSASPPEPLAIGGMNRLVRHPLYLGLLLIVWGLATSPFRLATAAAATVYLLIGIRFEERNLLRLYGEAYRDYRAKVPMLLPLLPKRH
ncbi:isoprenylcysteine carboxylmethyltransferase family protein [Acidiphilium sp. C61]|jgi:protein-S-isoprenylcysteine O-methyltransferase Ste14|uniref:methyltransferase family protein n=1 Tax=Acidiphilium sp. C61 TaxID=1671485 RepID=UPI00157AA603|nr:isoprenylcysteine carboxylmethyltransferase family protein [Acidiphilium sp. C61]